MKRHFIHRIRSARQGLVESSSIGAVPLPEMAQSIRALTNRVILNAHDESIVSEVRQLFAEVPMQTEPVAADRVKIKVRLDGTLPEIPAPYAWKGGAARSSLRHALHLRALPYPLRDLDIVRIGRGWTDLDAELSKQYMAEDFEHGHGVEVTETADRYFYGRDFSINEVMLRGSEIISSVVCILDSLGQILRPCRYFRGTLHSSPELSSRSWAKMLRLWAEFLEAGESWALTGVPQDQDIDAQHLSFELNKGFARGPAVGWRMIGLARELGILPTSDPNDPLCSNRQALRDLIDETYGGAGFFTNIEEQTLSSLVNQDIPGKG